MKNLILAAAFAFCGSVFAAGVDLTVDPIRPVVITSDFFNGRDMIYGPWIRNDYVVSTDRDLVINKMSWVVNFEGRQYRYELRLNPVHVKAGATFKFKDVYLARGPWTSMNYHSLVSVVATGWLGTLNNPVGRLEITRQFETQ